MARKTYDDVKTLCIVCGNAVPTDRIARGGITCSKEHAKLRRAQLQAITDKKECRYCRRPSTPEERVAYARFRTMEKKWPHIIYIEAFDNWKRTVSDPNPEAFAKWWREQQ